MQTMLETWERENPDLEWQSCCERTCSNTGVQCRAPSHKTVVSRNTWALIRSSAHASAVTAVLNDWRYKVECDIRIRYVSNAARSMSARQGLGKCDILMCAACGAKLMRIVAIGV